MQLFGGRTSQTGSGRCGSSQLGGLLYLGNHKGTSVAKATWVRDGVRKVAKTRTWVTLLAVVGTCLVSTLREGCGEVTSPDANGKRISWAAVWKME